MPRNHTSKGKTRKVVEPHIEIRATTPAAKWQLQTAKARFSEVFRRARTEGPQWVTKQDKEAVVILPAEEFEALTARAKQPKSLVQFLRESPLTGSGINLEREADYGRDVDL
jgi:prevent-host-death family protein